MARFSALQRAEIAETLLPYLTQLVAAGFSALQRAEIAEIVYLHTEEFAAVARFSALQRAEIAEIVSVCGARSASRKCFSALQRAEIAERIRFRARIWCGLCFSALQRAEIAEMQPRAALAYRCPRVSVLFNEPKLLKSRRAPRRSARRSRFQCSSTSRNC